MKNTKTASLSLRKLVLSVLVTAPLATLPVPLWALPADQAHLAAQIQSVSSGVSYVSTSATRVDVTSTAANSVIKWVNFGDASNMTIGAGDTINYALPGSSSSVLNMVTGTSSTLVNGTLSSNGNIYVLNPNGITIGATGVITANGVGLSTVPETEYNFLTTGALTGVENQAVATSNPVNTLAGATITAASGSGNVWIAGKGANLSGTIDGKLTVSSVRSGDVNLGANGDLTVGNVTTGMGTVSVTTDGGAITAGNNVVVLGPTVSLTTGNAAISQTTGMLQIGAGSPNNATLTTSSGTGAQDFENVQINGTGTLTVNATSNAAAITVKSGAGKLAVGATGGALTVQSASTLTLNAGNVTSVTATSGGDILSGGVLATTGAISLNEANDMGNVTLHVKAAPASVALTTTSGNNTFTNVTLTQDTGNVTVPVLNTTNLSVTGGNINFGGTQNIAGNASYTATGNVTIDQAITAGNLTVSAGTDINQSAAVNAQTAATGKFTYTATNGNVTTMTGGTIGATTAPASLTITAGNAITLGDAIAASKISATAATDLTTAAINGTDGNSTISLTGTAGNVTIGGAIGGTTPGKSVTINGGGFVTLNGAITTASGTVSATAGTNLTQNAAISSGNATLGSTTLKATAGNVSITQGITSGTATITANKLLTIGGAITASNVSATAGTDISQTAAISATGGNVSLSSTGGNITVGNTIGADTVAINASQLANLNAAVTTVKSLSVTAGTNLTQSAVGTIAGGTGNVSLTSTAGNVSLAAAVAGGNISVTSNNLLTATAGITGVTSASLSAGGNVTVAAVSAPQLAISGAAITQTDSITSTGNATVTSTGAATLNNAGNDFNVLVLKTGGNASVTDANGLTIGDGTHAAGNVTLTTTGAVQFGNSTSGAVTFDKDLTVTTNGGAVTDATNNTMVGGNLTVTTGGGDVTLDGAQGTGVGLNSSYGQVNLTTGGGNATLMENTTLNLGTINLGAGNLLAYSNTGIINTGVITTTTGNVTVGAGTASAPGDVSLNYIDSHNNTNQIGGTITLLDDLHLLNRSSSVIGNYLVNNLTVVNGATNADLLTLTANVYGNQASTNVNLRTVGSTALQVGQLSTTGTVALTADTGGITANNAANTFTNVSVQSNDGAVNISSTKDLLVNTAGNVGIAGAGTTAYASGGNLTIGNYNSNSTGATSFTASSGAIADSVPGIHIYGPVSFTGKSVMITQSGHSFGGVTIDTHASNGNAVIVESGTLNLVSVMTGNGTFTATSSNGSIIQPSSGSLGIITGPATFTANNGDVVLNDSTNNAFGNVSVTAMGNATIDNTLDTALAGLTASKGGVTVNVTSGKNISQVSGATIYSYGPTSFVTGGAGKITLTNSGNQFGGLTLTTGSGNIGITEQTTMNLKSVTTSGTFTATSAGGSIIDSGSLNATGTSILSAPNGDIALTHGSAWNTVSLTAGGNASIAGNTTLTLTLGNSTIGGNLVVNADTLAQSGSVAVGGNDNLTIKNGLAFGNTTVGGNLVASGGSVTQPGTLSVTGNASITSSGTAALNTETIGGTLTVNAGGAVSQTGAINATGDTVFTGTTLTLNNTSNQFGAFRFTTTGDTLIDEATTFNLRAGSLSTGRVTINTGGDFVTSGTGGSSFTGGTDATNPGLTINATGTIIPGAGSLLVTNYLKVNSPSLKDLSALSLSGNLNGKNPINAGTGAYTGPSTP